jgi:hypothetical protein
VRQVGMLLSETYSMIFCLYGNRTQDPYVVVKLFITWNINICGMTQPKGSKMGETMKSLMDIVVLQIEYEYYVSRIVNVYENVKH